LAITRDQYDTIDLTNNELRKLDNFPLLKRLRTLLVSNNQITRLELDDKLPSLEMLVLNNNPLADVDALGALKGFKSLRHLSLIDSPVTRVPHYRLLVVAMLPQLRALDFTRITADERRAAVAYERTGEAVEPESKRMKLDDGARIEEALKGAKSLDEIKQLERILATGHVPQ
jgi:U2 small nuclear ribonucleoprotein A'